MHVFDGNVGVILTISKKLAKTHGGKFADQFHKKTAAETERTAVLVDFNTETIADFIIWLDYQAAIDKIQSKNHFPAASSPFLSPSSSVMPSSPNTLLAAMNMPPAYPPRPLMLSACTAVMRSRFSMSAMFAVSCASCDCRCDSWRGLLEGAVERREPPIDCVRGTFDIVVVDPACGAAGGTRLAAVRVEPP